MAYEKYQQIEKYGRKVWTHAGMDEMRKSECLCRHCSKCGPCPIAREGYEFCKKHDVAYSMTRCPEFSEGTPQVEF